MKKILSILCIGAAVTMTANAQQALQEQNTYLMMPFGLSPSYTGLGGGTEIGLSYRNHWSGVVNSPARLGLLVSSAFSERVGMGLTASNFSGGIFSQNQVAINYTYHIPLSDENKLSLSMQASYHESSISNTHSNVDFASDPLLSSRMGLRQSIFNGGASALFSTSLVELGVYSPNLFRNTTQNENTYQLNFDQTMYGPAALFHAGIKKELGDGSILRITGIGRSQRALPFNYEASASYHLKQKVLLGASIRQQGLLGFHGGYTTGNVRFMYSYELPGSNIEGKMAQAHEVNLILVLGGSGSEEPGGSGNTKKKKNQVDDNTERIEKLNNNLQYQSDNFKKYKETTDGRLDNIESKLENISQAPPAPPSKPAPAPNKSMEERIRTLVDQYDQMNKPGIKADEKARIKASYDKEAEEINQQLSKDKKSLELIAGAFGVESNAKKVAAELNGKGVKASVFKRSDKELFYISAGSHKDIRKALEQKAALNTKGTYTWIYVK